MEEMVEITKARHEELLEAEAKLDALRAHGVDNWDGYGDAMEYLEQCRQGDE